LSSTNIVKTKKTPQKQAMCHARLKPFSATLERRPICIRIPSLPAKSRNVAPREKEVEVQAKKVVKGCRNIHPSIHEAWEGKQGLKVSIA
jgi:hypothetical protein